MLALLEKRFGLDELLAKLLIPHHKNNHHPWLIRHFSLFLITGVLIGVQFVYNLQVGHFQVLGFATNIFQNQIIGLSNQQRQINGIGTLTENSLLDQAAAAKAADMFAKNYWAHFAPDGTSPWYFFNNVGYKYSWAGENLARDFQTSEGVVQGWMNSPSHRENLLNNNYTEMGVAVVNGTLLGEETTLVVQLFGKPVSAAPANPASSKPNSQSLQPVPQVNTKTVNDNFVLENSKTKSSTSVAAAPVTKVSGQFVGGTNWLQKLAVLPWGAKVELSLLFILFSVFVVDTLVLYHRKINRPGSHSLVHAVVIGIMIVSVLVTSGGKLI